MAIFEKKVIIGSVAGFIASAVGLIAVFFPSVFNLEKKSIAEKAMFIRTKQDMDKLWEFLSKNANKPVRLDIGYCFNPKRAEIELKQERPSYDTPRVFYKMDKHIDKWYGFEYVHTNRPVGIGDTYIDHIGDNPRMEYNPDIDIEDAFAKRNEVFDMTAVGKIADFVMGAEGHQEGFYIEEGGLSYRADYGKYGYIVIPFSSQKNKKYAWAIGTWDYSNDNLPKYDKCPNDYNMIPYGYISGYFFVREAEVGGFGAYLDTPYSEFLADYKIELEPLDKRDLEMKKY
ncbi:hypothetical protein [Helicobacter sp. T3_23-1056]